MTDTILKASKPFCEQTRIKHWAEFQASFSSCSLFQNLLLCSLPVTPLRPLPHPATICPTRLIGSLRCNSQAKHNPPVPGPSRVAQPQELLALGLGGPAVGSEDPDVGPKETKHESPFLKLQAEKTVVHTRG